MCSVPLSSMTLQHVSRSNQGAICPPPQKLTPLNLCLRHHRCPTRLLLRENSPVRFWPWRRLVLCQCSLVIFCRCFILCSRQSWSRQFCYWARANHRTVANRCRIIMIGVHHPRCYQLVRCWLLMNECKTLNVDFVTFVYRHRWCRFLFFSTHTKTINKNDNKNDTFQRPNRYQR